MKTLLIPITLIISFYSISQDCEKIMMENKVLKNQISNLIDTNQIVNIKSFDPNFTITVNKVIGNKDEQTVDVVLLISHNNVHQEVCLNVGTDECKAYDDSGNVYDTRGGKIGAKSCLNSGTSSKFINTSYSCEKIPTSIPVKATVTIRKIMSNTLTIKKLIVKIGFRDFEGNQQYKYGEIEIDNLTINWLE